MSKFTIIFIQYFYQVNNIYNNINNIMHRVLFLTKLTVILGYISSNSSK